MINMKYEIPDSPEPFNDLSAAELVSKIRIGWNLGNSLDTINPAFFKKETTVAEMETRWRNPVTTKNMITTIKNAGFDTLRIPVTWCKAADSNYKIRADWMERVVQIVNYAADNDMYIILNTHHDEGIFKFTDAQTQESLITFRKIWEQIADTFKNYNEKLIFEALNEPRTIGSDLEWKGGTSEERANLNKHYQVFIDTVRNSGGNNGKRVLMVNTHAASIRQEAIEDLVIPVDTVPNKIIASIHAYEPTNFALNTKPVGVDGSVNTWSMDNTDDVFAITDPIDRAFSAFIAGKGIPVIIGEFGAVNKNNTETRTVWAEFFVKYARNKGIPCIWWDNGLDIHFLLLDRHNETLKYPSIIEALMKGSII
jgi:endoglucanase